MSSTKKPGKTNIVNFPTFPKGMFPSAESHPIVPIIEGEVGGERVNAVDARELHAKLEVGRDFTNWIKGRLETLSGLGLAREDVDFCVISHSPDPANGIPRGKTDYIVTLDLAKHLAMMENNERGFAIRQDFIDFEKKIRSLPPAAVRPAQSAFQRERRLLERERRLSAKMKIDALRDYLRITGELATPEARAVVAAKVVEVATGEKLSSLLPADAEAKWLLPSEMEEAWGVSVVSIGRAITALDLRGKPGLSKPFTNLGLNGRQCTSYRYSPDAVRMVRAQLVRDGKLASGSEPA